MPGSADVLINSSGQLGTVSSSIRYKRDVRDMGDASDKLMKLRPVTFRYKTDPTSTEQYGLIAEEVAKVYPELVVNGAHGKPEAVAYHMLPAMLLNEVQKQAREHQQLADRVERQARQLALKDAQIAALQRQLTAVNKTNMVIYARLDALEQQAHASTPERVAAATR